MKQEFPILEYDKAKNAVIDPSNILKDIDAPEHVVVCFFNEVITKLKEQGQLKLITNITTEMGNHPIYEFEHLGKRLVVFHPGVGAPLAVAILEGVIALGGKKFIACGGAGVLNKEIAVGHIIVPKTAVREEGVSYHYLPPSREVEASSEAIKAIEETLENHKYKYVIGKTWTTDAIFRETHEKVKLRKEEGCLTVEMEAAAFFAVAKFRNVLFGQILSGGDDVSKEEWDAREEIDRKPIRERMFWLAAEACLNLS